MQIQQFVLVKVGEWMSIWRVVVLVASILGVSFAQDMSVTRGQFWGRISVLPQFENGWSGVISASMRDNISISKEVNGVEKEIAVQGNWLNELYLGAGWKHSVGERSLFSNQLVYRPQFWYSDRVAGDPYLRHTVMNSANLFHKFPRITIHQRVNLWGLFETKREDLHYDNELILRYMVGPELKIGDKTSLFIKAEPFLKLTANESDADGTELFHRFYTWSGVTIAPHSKVKLSAQYVNMRTFLTDHRTIVDHTLYISATFTPNWR